MLSKTGRERPPKITMMPRLSTALVLWQPRDSARGEKTQTIMKRHLEAPSQLVAASPDRSTKRVYKKSDVAHPKYHWHS